MTAALHREPKLSDNVRKLIADAITGNEGAEELDDSVALQTLEALATEANVLTNAWRSRDNALCPVMLEEGDLLNCLSRFVVRARVAQEMVRLLDEQDRLYGESEAAQ